MAFFSSLQEKIVGERVGRTSAFEVRGSDARQKPWTSDAEVRATTQLGFLTPAGKGGALAPPVQGPLVVALPRLPHSPAGAGLCGRRGEKKKDARNFGGAKAPPFRCPGPTASRW
jgi:hypothetical protein